MQTKTLTQSQARQLSIAVRGALNAMNNNMMILKTINKIAYENAIPGSPDGDAWFQKLNEIRTEMRRTKAALAKTVPIQKILKQASK